jgi:hypothetical protein
MDYNVVILPFATRFDSTSPILTRANHLFNSPPPLSTHRLLFQYTTIQLVPSLPVWTITARNFGQRVWILFQFQVSFFRGLTVSFLDLDYKSTSRQTTARFIWTHRYY